MSNDKGNVYLTHGGKKLFPASHSVFSTCPTCKGTSMTYRKEEGSAEQCLTCWGNTEAEAVRPTTVYTLTIHDDGTGDESKAKMTVDVPGKPRQSFDVEFYLSATAVTDAGAHTWDASTAKGKLMRASREGGQ